MAALLIKNGRVIDPAWLRARRNHRNRGTSRSRGRIYIDLPDAEHLAGQ
jgi:hypothetical protein